MCVRLPLNFDKFLFLLRGEGTFGPYTNAIILHESRLLCCLTCFKYCRMNKFQVTDGDIAMFGILIFANLYVSFKDSFKSSIFPQPNLNCHTGAQNGVILKFLDMFCTNNKKRLFAKQITKAPNQATNNKHRGG